MRAAALVILFLACHAWGVTLAGQEYLELRNVARRLGTQIRVSADGKEAILAAAGRNVEVTLNQRGSTINGTRVWLNYPIGEIKDVLYLSRLDYERTVVPLLQPNAFPLNRLRLRHIVLDPGHGGRDTGARNTKLKILEKTITLDVAARVQQRLEALGYQVTLTRGSDRFVELKDRAALANTLRADLFVSIHFNSAAPDITGVETYCYTPQGAPSSSREELSAADKISQPANARDVANLWAGYCLQKAMVSDLRAPDRAVRHARFVVLESLRCPGILIEGGFITSPAEGSRLTSTLYRQQLANAIVDGIRSYHRRILVP